MASRAPSRQSHACGVCGKVYSRSEYVRRHYLAKHAPKLNCPECDSSFTRQDLLLRHVKIFHPARETPSPSELADQLDLPPPLPLPMHQDSMDSVSSFNSQASSGTASSFLGGPIASSPELMARGFVPELPVPPLPSTSARRMATYPLPPSSLSHAVPYTPYPIPVLSNLPQPMYESPAASPSTSSFPPPHQPVPGPSGSGSTSTVRGASRSHTMPMPWSSLPSGFGAAASSGTSSFPAPAPKPGFVDAEVQTELLAAHIPPYALHLPLATPTATTSATFQQQQQQQQQYPHHVQPLFSFARAQYPHAPEQTQQQPQPQHTSAGAPGASDTALADFLRAFQPSPFRLDEYNSFGFAAANQQQGHAGGAASGEVGSPFSPPAPQPPAA
ncbi:hypothetical protein JCM8097_009410 [Rhodosporidiobolus ruineniae]